MVSALPYDLVITCCSSFQRIRDVFRSDHLDFRFFQLINRNSVITVGVESDRRLSGVGINLFSLYSCMLTVDIVLEGSGRRYLADFQRASWRFWPGCEHHIHRAWISTRTRVSHHHWLIKRTPGRYGLGTRWIFQFDSEFDKVWLLIFACNLMDILV